MTDKEGLINQYENSIFEQLKDSPKLRGKELDELIAKKIKEENPDKYKNLYPEDWQAHYAEERIKTNIKKYNKLKKESSKELRGFGGWLLLVAFGVVLNPFLIVYYFYLSYKIDEPSALSSIIFMLLMLFSFYIIFLFFTKKRRFVKWYIILLIFSIIIACFNLLNFVMFEGKTLLESIEEPISNTLEIPLEDVGRMIYDNLKLIYIKSFFRSLLAGIIWTLYLLNSRRVKNTFVN